MLYKISEELKDKCIFQGKVENIKMRKGLKFKHTKIDTQFFIKNEKM